MESNECSSSKKILEWFTTHSWNSRGTVPRTAGLSAKLWTSDVRLDMFRRKLKTFLLNVF